MAELIKALLNVGYSPEDIAMQLNVEIAEVRRASPKQLPMTMEALDEADALYPDATQTELKQIYNAYSLAPPKAKRELSGLDLASLGSTHSEIARAVGKSRTWVTARLGKLGAKQSAPGKVKDWHALLEYHKANSLSATAKKFGVSMPAIIQYKKRHNIVL